MHDWFKAAARGPAPDREPLEATAALIAEMKARMGVFVSPVTRALDIAKAELGDARRGRDLEAAARLRLEAQVRDLLAERQAAEAAVDEMLART